ncbi:MAG: hypothetical protein ACE15E_13260, partial [Acidobacteriota bacterium]
VLPNAFGVKNVHTSVYFSGVETASNGVESHPRPPARTVNVDEFREFLRRYQVDFDERYVRD